MPRARAKISAPLFPFLGAGEATYFEWAEVHVRFTRPPRPAERKQIAAKVPPPLRDSVEFKGRDLMVASGQTAHVEIHATYHRPGDPVEDDDDDDDYADFDGRWFFASTAAVSRFNKDIEAWLNHAHAVVPILFAFRGEDGESGGTELSDWHRASVELVPQILAACEDVLASRDEDAPGAFAVRGVIEMALEARVAVAPEWRRWLHPGADAIAAERAAKKTPAKKSSAKKTAKKPAAEKSAKKKSAKKSSKRKRG
jgi:NADH:ubiquinone oxidoreductase subunit